MFYSTLELNDKLDKLRSHIELESARSEAISKIHGFSKEKTDCPLTKDIDLNGILPTLDGKIYNYKSSIISTYGALENFVEQIAIEYISMIEGLNPVHDNLPEKIKSTHLILSMDLIKKIQNNRNIDEEEKHNRVLSILEKAQVTAQKNGVCKLNGEAYAMHTSNFRQDTIDTLFSNMGISGISASATKFSPLKEYFELYGNQDEVNISLVQIRLKKLADTRNEIAHGSFDDQNIEASEIVLENIEFIRNFCNSLSNVVYINFLGVCQLMGKLATIGMPQRIFSGISVLGYSSKNQHFAVKKHEEIKVGDIITAEDSGMNIINFGKIVGIKVGNATTTSAIMPSKLDVTFNVNFEISTKNNRYYSVLRI